MIKLALVPPQERPPLTSRHPRCSRFAVVTSIAILTCLFGSSHSWAAVAVPLFTPAGTTGNSWLGLFVSDVGDINGDGVDDFAVGAPAAGKGRVWLYWGGPGLDATPDLVLEGQATGDYFGNSVRGCGDVNGDGWDDLVVGAPWNDAIGDKAGRAYVFFGGPAPDAIADLIFSGATAGEWFGWSVAGPGDLDGNGPDILVGSPYFATNLGRAYVYCGGAALDSIPDVILAAPNAGWFGWFVNGAGDFDSDGWNDCLIGSNTAGLAYLYRGGPGFDGTVDLIFTSPGGAGDRFGYGLAPAGDVNGDGHDDVIIGAMHNDAGGEDAGRAYVYFGGSSPNVVADLVLTGTVARGIFGRTVAGGGI